MQRSPEWVVRPDGFSACPPAAAGARAMPPPGPAPLSRRATLAAPLVLLLAAAAAAPPPGQLDSLAKGFSHRDRSIHDTGGGNLPAGCLHEGRWHRGGALVSTRDGCLRCACALGALSCRRRACAPLPDPPPSRCHVLHRKGACCPELHCPDGVRIMEHEGSGRFANEDSDIATPSAVVHACVEGGSVFAAGSALSSSVACEQCFCLAGGRRCVRPRCLPPPPGCQPRPAPGACCPQRYYCNHNPPPVNQRHQRDCEVEGRWVSEGERVVAAQSNKSCTQCFCLRGAVHCQPLACAPPLHGCKPLLRPGECCPHQYQCEHNSFGTPKINYLSDNSILSTRYDDRSFHKAKSSKQETTTTVVITTTTEPSKPTTNNTNNYTQTITTNKVKRKTNETFANNTEAKNAETKIPLEVTTAKVSTVTDKPIVSTEEPFSTTTDYIEKATTLQPEGTVKIMINGTINCTAELSSTSMPLNLTSNDVAKIKLEAQPRVPLVNIESQTFNPNDIITERNHIGDFDENETFTINVTSSLRTNASTSRPSLTTVAKPSVVTQVVDVSNMSKKNVKGDFDYDYTEPTLPPSLPNLKIIPFVAADAVVDDDAPSSKEALTYPILEREDKYPVYYPKVESKEIFASRRHDVYNITQYPVYPPDSTDIRQYPSITQKDGDLIDSYSRIHGNLPHPISGSSIESHYVENHKPSTNAPVVDIQTPAVNLFSPPVETEGGFIPKGPGIIDEYYAVYPSTPSGHAVPNLTTSMQLDAAKDDCTASDGRRIPEGESISLACSVCSCAWGELHCSPRVCPTPPGCTRRPATTSTLDLCCGELVCSEEKTTTSPFFASTRTVQITLNETIVPIFKVNETLKENVTETTAAPVKTTVFNMTTKIESVSESLSTKANERKTTNVTDVMSTTEKLTTTSPLTTMTAVTESTMTHPQNTTNTTMFNSQEYEEEEEDEEGFSLGSVLKLLLSETNYDTTTAKTYKQTTTTTTRRPATTVTSTTPKPASPTTPAAGPRPPVVPFIPLPHHHFPFTPPKKALPQNTVNRIDHLVLGEATAIKKTTPHTTTVVYSTTAKPVTKVTVKTEEVGYTSVSHEGPRQPGPGLVPGGGGPGLLKLAGCNIYGRMYRVGRIIIELSTPCQECRCTEFGVHCRSLNC